jgi:RNA polymerase sigma factor (sigma-70 family)
MRAGVVAVSDLSALGKSLINSIAGRPSMGAVVKLNKDQCASLSDQALVRLIHSGNKELASELIRRHSSRLFFIIRKMVMSDFTAEDILQDTWILALTKLKLFDTERPLEPWLTCIAINSCRNYWRKEKRHNFWKLFTSQIFSSHTESNEQSCSCDQVNADHKSDISKALLTLSTKLREVVVLKFYSGMTQEEISDALNIPTGTVKSRLHIALSKLKEFFEKEVARS